MTTTQIKRADMFKVLSRLQPAAKDWAGKCVTLKKSLASSKIDKGTEVKDEIGLDQDKFIVKFAPLTTPIGGFPGRSYTPYR